MSGDPDAIIAALQLAPHPEGGWYRETLRLPAGPDGRSAGTAIYYLLKRGERSAWHRVDATELWLFHAGEPMRLRLSDGGDLREIILGADVAAGQSAQAAVAPGEWQCAEPAGAYALVSCVVAPGFEFSGFEMAPEGWEPGGT